MDFDITSVAALVGLVLGLLSLIDKYYGTVNSIKTRIAKIEEIVKSPNAGLESRLAALETKIGPFWRVLEENLVNLLRKPTHFTLDELLDAYRDTKGNLSEDRLSLLKCELLSAKEEAQKNSDIHLLGYVLMLGVVEAKLEEKKCTPGKKG